MEHRWRKYSIDQALRIKLGLSDFGWVALESIIQQKKYSRRLFAGVWQHIYQALLLSLKTAPTQGKSADKSIFLPNDGLPLPHRSQLGRGKLGQIPWNIKWSPSASPMEGDFKVYMFHAA